MTSAAAASVSPSTRRLLDDLRERKPAALARAVSIVENQRAGFEDLLGAIQPDLGRGRRIGVTGPPGAGKSTLVTRLVEGYRQAGLSVAILAVDPTSPFTGGALLGDRIRMEAVALDPGVYIRSLATRGALGGISGATRAVVNVLDASGFDRIIVETVGVGQSELEIAEVTDTTVVVLVPESGDSIQALKAGLMEIADVFAINKADRPGADRARSDLELMLGLRVSTRENAAFSQPSEAVSHDLGHHADALNPARLARRVAASDQVDHWVPPVTKTVAVTGDGIEEFSEAVDRHFRYLETSGELQSRRRRRLRQEIRDATDWRVRRRLWDDAAVQEYLDTAVSRIERGELNLFHAADELLALGAQRIANAGRRP